MFHTLKLKNLNLSQLNGYFSCWNKKGVFNAIDPFDKNAKNRIKIQFEWFKQRTISAAVYFNRPSSHFYFYFQYHAWLKMR